MQHWLSGNKAQQLPQNAVWVDTETRQLPHADHTVRHVLRFGWACHQRTHKRGGWTHPAWHRFTTPGELWDWVERLTRPKTRLYLFAHNWGFDGPVLNMFMELPQRGWKLRNVVIDGPPVILSWHRGGRTIEVLDTLNWWRVSLSSLGESLGLAKLKMPGQRAPRKAWDAYCRRDVEVIRLAKHSWWTFLREYDLGGFARTLAGQSMRAFRHRFMDHPILIDADERATGLARQSYHGGRTECFRLGRIEGPIHVLDVNSMYPAVMADHSYPTVLKTVSRSASIRELHHWALTRAVVADVDLETDSPQYAHLYQDKLAFPVGRFRASLTTPDVRAAIDQGHLKKVHQVAVYDAAPLFSRFVREIYQLRLDARAQGNQVSDYLLKILLNSLYGKFAQRGITWDTVAETDSLEQRTWLDHDMETGVTRTLRQFAGIVQAQTKDPEAFSSHPAIASHVTAYARRRLWDLFNLAGRANVMYCDTDSLYVNSLGYARLTGEVDPGSLGRLKHEAVLAWIVINGPKDYVTPEKRKTKGVRASATWLSDDTVRQEQWSSLAGLLRTGQLSAPTTKVVEKKLARIYGKGTVDRSGVVSPFRLAEW